MSQSIKSAATYLYVCSYMYMYIITKLLKVIL